LLWFVRPLVKVNIVVGPNAVPPANGFGFGGARKPSASSHWVDSKRTRYMPSGSRETFCTPVVKFLNTMAMPASLASDVGVADVTPSRPGPEAIDHALRSYR
jgi:hypothetical protein